jgi:small subunit ribosomal protein S1
MAQRPNRPVTIRQKIRRRKPTPELPTGTGAKDDQGTAQQPPKESSRRTPSASRSKPRNLLKAEDLQALADMDRDVFAAAMAGTVPLRIHQVGDRVTGTVVRLDSQVVFVDLGGKAEGAIDRAELLGPDGQLVVEIGHAVTAFVVDMHDGGVQLSHQIRGEDAGPFLEKARDEGIPIEGRVSEKNSGGFVVILAGRRAFCPLSQMALPGRPVDADAFVGRTLNFLVQELKGQDVVVTRRPLLEAEAAEAAARLWASLKPGTTLTGTVTSIRDYGVFVDVGGLDGLVHISELAWGHVKDPRDVVEEGQTVSVRVLQVDPAAGRLSLSLKVQSARPVDPDAAPSTPEAKLGTLGDLFAGLTLKK